MTELDPAKVKALEEFARERIREAWDGCDGGDEIQAHAKKLGLIIEEPGGYDPEKHGKSYDAEPGETWFVFADWLDLGLSPAGPQEGFPQPQRKDGEGPCGECHLQPNEVCDICGAARATPAPDADVAGLNAATIIAGIREFGLAPDGADLRDLEAVVEALQAEVDRYKRLLDLEATDHDAASARATAAEAEAEAEAAALRAEVVPEALRGHTFAVQHNPNCPSPWLVRLPGKSGRIDLKPYGHTFPPVKHETDDILGFGKTFDDAARAALGKAESPADTKAGG